MQPATQKINIWDLFLKRITFMTPKPLDVLKKGLYKVSKFARTQPSISISSLLNDLAVQRNIIADAERQVEEAIDELVMRGALQTRNRMDIKSLLASLKS